MGNGEQIWPGGRRAVVSLTYDDGIANHHQYVAPTLERYGLRGTFYTPLNSDLSQNPAAWRRLARRGHELGNHTVFHPCWSIDGKYSDWLPDAYNLETYTPERWNDEILASNQALWLVDSKTERTFGNTCSDNYLGPKDNPVALETLAPAHFVAARGEGTGKPVNLAQINFYNLGTVPADHRTFADFEPELANLLDTGGWIIYTIHGVGAGTHSQYIDVVEHERLLVFLQANRRLIWTAPLIEVVRRLKQNAASERRGA